jgi:hypothetical protein
MKAGYAFVLYQLLLWMPRNHGSHFFTPTGLRISAKG